MAAELEDFDLGAALRRGLLPLVVAAGQPDDVLKAYASLYLDEEVRWEGWARNIGAFARFLEAASFSHATVLNTANVARECQIERRTVASYIEVLEDLLLAFRLPVFTRRASRDLSQHPKFNFFDAGVFRSLRPRGGRWTGRRRLTARPWRVWWHSTCEPGWLIAAMTRGCTSGVRGREWK
jgi:predicted AAA+ superfamily ATPase